MAPALGPAWPASQADQSSGNLIGRAQGYLTKPKQRLGGLLLGGGNLPLIGLGYLAWRDPNRQLFAEYRLEVDANVFFTKNVEQLTGLHECSDVNLYGVVKNSGRLPRPYHHS